VPKGLQKVIIKYAQKFEPVRPNIKTRTSRTSCKVPYIIICLDLPCFVFLSPLWGA